MEEPAALSFTIAYVDDQQLASILSELVDECSFDKPLNWESLNFDEIKSTTIHAVIKLFRQYPQSAQSIEVMSMMAYLLIENTQLWVEQQLAKRGNPT